MESNRARIREDYAHISICSYADNICHRLPVFAAGASRCTHRACRRNLRGHPQGAPIPMQNDMIYGSDIHHRRSIRLKPTPGTHKGRPYSQAGAYFITARTRGAPTGCLLGQAYLVCRPWACGSRREAR